MRAIYISMNTLITFIKKKLSQRNLTSSISADRLSMEPAVKVEKKINKWN